MEKVCAKWVGETPCGSKNGEGSIGVEKCSKKLRDQILTALKNQNFTDGDLRDTRVKAQEDRAHTR